MNIDSDEDLKNRAYLVLGTLTLLCLAAWLLSPKFGYEGKNMLIPILLLFTTSALLLGALITIKGKVDIYYNETYSKVMIETSGVQIPGILTINFRFEVKLELRSKLM